MQDTRQDSTPRLVALSRAALDSAPQRDPETYWRVGFTIPAVAAEYAYPREDLSDSLVDALAAGGNVLLSGPRGCGKSTICKCVATRWLADTDGDVFYHGRVNAAASDDTVSLADVERLARGDGASDDDGANPDRALVVVEDALREPPDVLAAIFDAILDADSVSVLVEARRGQLERKTDATGFIDRAAADTGSDRDAPGETGSDSRAAPPDVRRVLEGESFETHRVPALDDQSVDAITAYYDDLVDADVDTAGAVASATTTSDGSAAADEWLRIAHGLTSEHDPRDALDRTVREAYESVTAGGTRDLRARIALAVNLCNAARIPIRDEILYGLVDDRFDATSERSDSTADSRAVVEEAVASLAGTVLPSDDDGRYLLPHEIWSSVYVRQLVAQESTAVARERFAAVVDRLLAVASTPSREAVDDAEGALEDDVQNAHDDATVNGQDDATTNGHDDETTNGHDEETTNGHDDATEDPTATPTRHSKVQAETTDDSLIANELGGESASSGSVVTTTPTSTDRGSLTVASVLTRLGEFGKRWPILAPVYETGPDRPLEVKASCSAWMMSQFASARGEIHLASGDLKRADDCFDESIETVRSASSDDATLAKATVHYRLNKAKTARKRGEHDDALTHLEVAESTASERAYRAGSALAALALGKLRSKQGEIERAIEDHRRSLAGFRAIGHRRMTANVRKEIGNLQFRRGDYEGARDHYERALEIYRRLGDRDGEASCLSNLGVVETYQERFDIAREHQERSLAIRERIGARAKIASTLNNLGILERRAGNLDAAREYYERSLERKHEMGDREAVASSLGNLGVVHRELGNLETAADYERESLEIYESIGAPRNCGKCLNDLGRIYFDQGRLDAAESALERALDRFEGTDDSGGIGRANQSLAEVAFARGDREVAFDHYDRAFASLSDAGSFEAVDVAMTAVGEALASGESARALGFFEAARAYAKEHGFDEQFADRLSSVEWAPPEAT